MKKLIFIFFISASVTSCKKTEHGTTDNESLSRKLFNTVRDNDVNKTHLLIPDKATYKKILSEQKTLKDINIQYEDMLKQNEQNFNSVRQMLPDWSLTKYDRTAEDILKQEDFTSATVTTKFEIQSETYKFSFVSAKFNNRWYYLGDVVWVEKTAPK